MELIHFRKPDSDQSTGSINVSRPVFTLFYRLALPLRKLHNIRLQKHELSVAHTQFTLFFLSFPKNIFCVKMDY
jgi:hypothetical protein